MTSLPQNRPFTLAPELITFASRADQQAAAVLANCRQEADQLSRRHAEELAKMEQAYQASCAAVKKHADASLSSAGDCLDKIHSWDQALSQEDETYRLSNRLADWNKSAQTVDEDALRRCTGAEQSGVIDYLRELRGMSSRFVTLFSTYISGSFLNGGTKERVLNGLSYAISSRRKKDYNELIVLRNTAELLLEQMQRTLPQLTAKKLDALKADYLARRGSAEKRQETEKHALEQKYTNIRHQTGDRLRAELDRLLPDDQLDYFLKVWNNYGRSLYKVNSGKSIRGGVLEVFFLHYRQEEAVRQKFLRSALESKCEKLMKDGCIRLPAVMSARDTPIWLIASDGSDDSVVQQFTHAIMFGLLSSCPVGRLSYTIVDPEKRGNSVSPFFDAQMKLPELFGGGILTSESEVADRIRRLNKRIEEILQKRIGGRYETVFDYARANPGYEPREELVVLYDFPRGFDERTLPELENVLRNGSRCGIFTVIVCRPDAEENRTAQYKQRLEAIRSLSVTIRQTGRALSLYGLGLSYYTMPDEGRFTAFFNKYMLIFEGSKNRGTVFPPFIRQLTEEKDPAQLDARLKQLRGMMRRYERGYAQVPETDAPFPPLVTLGSVLYPADVFSDSAGYQRIVERFGVQEPGNAKDPSYVELPLTVDLRSPPNLLLTCPDGSGEMLQFTHHVIWSFLSCIPVGKVNVCVFDSEQRGNSVRPFLDFRKRAPEVFDQEIYTSQEAMTDRLQKISRHIDEFIMDKLGSRYGDILEYNQDPANRTEPVTLLVLYDFPKGMDGRSAALLTDILRSGNKCGVFTVICHNPDIAVSGYENLHDSLAQMARYCVRVEYKNQACCLSPFNLRLHTHEALSAAAADAFVSDYVNKCGIIKNQVHSLENQAIPFEKLLPPQNQWFTQDPAQPLSIPVGVGAGGSIIRLTFGEGSSHHALIAGGTGSGKSTLLHTVIMSAMVHYGPDQLHLYLMDFKNGTEFSIYGTFRPPHIQVLALDTMQEFGESILEKLVAEMDDRGSLFKTAGQTNLREYNLQAPSPLPRILVIMDEFQILFNGLNNQKVAKNCANLAKRIVTEGRAYGVHLLMATQSMKDISSLTLEPGIIEQMRIRIGLKCSRSDAVQLFSSRNDSNALELMEGPSGTAVMNPSYTEQDNIGFRVAFCDKETQKRYLEQISRSFAGTPASLWIFERGRTTRLLDYFAGTQAGITDELPVRLHMGERIEMAPPFALTLDKKRRNNLLVCGTTEGMTNIIAENYILSALLNRNVKVYCIDGDTLVGDDSSEDFYETAGQWSGRLRQARDQRDIFHFISEVYESFQARKSANGGGNEIILVMIKNLPSLDVVCSMLRKEPVDEPGEAPEAPTFDPADPFAEVNRMLANRGGGSEDLSTGEKLLKLMKNGYDFEIYFAVTSPEYQTVRECMYYGENILSKFPKRIIFGLEADDAERLAENVPVKPLRENENMVYFTDRDKTKNSFLLKPFLPPETEELRKFLQGLGPG